MADALTFWQQLVSHIKVVQLVCCSSWHIDPVLSHFSCHSPIGLTPSFLHLDRIWTECRQDPQAVVWSLMQTSDNLSLPPVCYLAAYFGVQVFPTSRLFCQALVADLQGRGAMVQVTLGGG